MTPYTARTRSRASPRARAPAIARPCGPYRTSPHALAIDEQTAKDTLNILLKYQTDIAKAAKELSVDE